MTRLDADGLKPGGHEMPTQPFRKWAGFQTHHVDLILPGLKFLDQWTGLTVDLPCQTS
jgi:hypothetical protein